MFGQPGQTDKNEVLGKPWALFHKHKRRLYIGLLTYVKTSLKFYETEP